MAKKIKFELEIDDDKVKELPLSYWSEHFGEAMKDYDQVNWAVAFSYLCAGDNSVYILGFNEDEFKNGSNKDNQG